MMHVTIGTDPDVIGSDNVGVDLVDEQVAYLDRYVATCQRAGESGVKNRADAIIDILLFHIDTAIECGE